MWIKSSFATLRWRSSLLSSLKAVRIAAHSLWMHARSSACVLQARTLRISSRSRIDMACVDGARERGLCEKRRERVARVSARE